MKKLFISIVIIVTFVAGVLLYYQSDSNTYIGLTKKDKAFEFEYLWNELHESYPFISFTQRSGVIIKDIYEFNKDKVVRSKSDIDYLKNLTYAIRDFGGAGHLSIISPIYYEKIYKPAYQIAKNDPELSEIMKPWINTFYDNDVVKSYSMFDTNSKRFRTTKNLKKKYTSKENTPKNNTNQQLQNLTIKYNNETKTAYLKINSFLSVNENLDREKLESFYSAIVDYENLIIDIRDNAGVSDLYWERLIVSPNITEQLSFSRYALFKMNSTIKPFIETRFAADDVKLVNELPKMPKLNKDDVKEMTHYVKTTSTVDAKPNKNTFKGKIWVLTSSKNYSSSENFVMFCKNTGFATLVGEVTNGDGGLMDPVLIKMPKSHVLVTYSVLYGLNSDGSCNEEFGTTPDYLIKQEEDALTICKQLIKDN